MCWPAVRSCLTILGIGFLCCCPIPAIADDEPGPIEAAEVTLDRPADFAKDILPILQAKCLACHSASKKEGGLVLETAASIRSGGDSGAAVVVGHPDESLLALSAGRRGDPSAMPPLPNEANAKPLTPQELGLLELWIREGAKDSAAAAEMIQWQPLPGEIDAVYSLALDPGERFVAAGRANRIHLYDIIQQREVQVLADPELPTGPESLPVAHRDIVSSLAFGPNGEWLASGGYRLVKLWHREAPLESRQSVDSPAKSLAVSSDSRWRAIGLEDGAIRLWDQTGGAQGTTIAGHAAPVSALRFDAAGTHLLSADSTHLKRWDLASLANTGQVRVPSPIRGVLQVSETDRFATAHEDGIIRIWTQEQFVLPVDGAADEAVTATQELKGHSQPVTTLAWAVAEGPRLLSGSEDGTVRQWDLAAGTEARQIAHGSPVTTIAATPDGTKFTSSGADGVTRLWAADGTKLGEVTGDPRPAAVLAQRQADHNVAQSRKSIADKAVEEAEKDAKEREESLKKAQESVTAAEKVVAEAKPKVEAAQKTVDEATASLAEMPDDEGRKKARTDAEAAFTKEQDALKKAEDAVVSAKRGVELSEKSLAAVQAEVETRKQRQSVETAGEAAAAALVTQAQEQTKAAAAGIRSVVFGPDGQWFATADEAGRIVQWSVPTQRALDVFETEGNSPLTAMTASATSGRLYSVTTTGHFETWRAQRSWMLAGQIGPQSDDPADLSASPIVDRVLALDFHPDGSLLAIGSGVPSRSGQLQLWDMGTKTLVREIPDAHSDSVFDVEFSRDGTQLASGAADKFAKVFDVATGQLQQSFEGHTGHVLSVAWKADGSVLATGGADNDIKAWTTATGEQQRTISSHKKPVNALAFVGVEEKLVSAAGDTNVMLHTVSNGRNYRTLAGAPDFLHAVSVSKDETRVIAGCEDGLIRIWNGTDGKLLMTFPIP